MVDVLLIGPHPDDIEIFAGGLALRLVERGYTVGGVDMTAGEAGTRGSPEERRVESRVGAERLGLVFRECLGLPDGHVRNDLTTRDLLIATLRRHRPCLVVAPVAVDHHPDHARTGEAIKEARFLAGCARIGPGMEPHRPGRILGYPSRQLLEPTLVVDVSDVFERKLLAVAAHASQLHDPTRDAPPTTIAAPGFLDDLRARARYLGSLIGVRYGEGFEVQGPLAIDDPVPVVRDLGQSVFLADRQGAGARPGGTDPDSTPGNRLSGGSTPDAPMPGGSTPRSRPSSDSKLGDPTTRTDDRSAPPPAPADPLA